MESISKINDLQNNIKDLKEIIQQQKLDIKKNIECDITNRSTENLNYLSFSTSEELFRASELLDAEEEPGRLIVASDVNVYGRLGKVR